MFVFKRLTWSMSNFKIGLLNSIWVVNWLKTFSKISLSEIFSVSMAILSLIIMTLVKSSMVSFSRWVDLLKPSMISFSSESSISMSSIRFKSPVRLDIGALKLWEVMYENCFKSLLFWVNSLMSCSFSFSWFFSSVTSLWIETQCDNSCSAL